MEEVKPTETSTESQLTLPGGEKVDYKTFVAEITAQFNEKLKDHDVKPNDVKNGNVPVELTDSEKTLPEAKQNIIKVNKFFRAIYRKDFNYLAQTKAINTEGSPGAGGYLMSPEFSAEVIRRIETYGVLDRYATKYNLSRQKMQIPVGSAKMTGAFVNEGSARSESNPTFTQKELSRKEYAVLSVISKQLLEDEEVDIMPILAEYAAEDFAYTRDYQGLLGTGSPITGIVAGTTTSANIIRTASEDFGASITGDQLIDMTHSLSGSRSQGAVAVMHRTTLGAYPCHT